MGEDIYVIKVNTSSVWHRLQFMLGKVVMDELHPDIISALEWIMPSVVLAYINGNTEIVDGDISDLLLSYECDTDICHTLYLQYEKALRNLTVLILELLLATEVMYNMLQLFDEYQISDVRIMSTYDMYVTFEKTYVKKEINQWLIAL